MGALKLRSSWDGRSSGEPGRPGCPGDLEELGVRGVRVSWGSGGSGVLARRDLRLASLLQVRSLPRMSISRSLWGCSSCAAAGALPRPLPDLLRAFPVFASAALRLDARIGRSPSCFGRSPSCFDRCAACFGGSPSCDARIGGSSRVLFQSSFFFAPNRPATKEETIAVMIAPKRQDRKPPVEKGKPSCVDSQPVNLKRTEFVTIAKSPKLNR